MTGSYDYTCKMVDYRIKPNQ